MMQNFQPPTDNLYKFLALTGVVLTLAGIALPSGMSYSLRIREFDFVAQIAEAKAEYEVWQAAEVRAQARREAYKVEGAKLNQFMAEHPKDSLPADVQVVLRDKALQNDKDTRALFDSLEQITDRAATADKAIGAINASAKEVEFLKWTAVASLWSGGTLLCIGIVLAVSGFTLWYRRTQRFQDQLLVAELNAAVKSSE